MQKPIIKMRLFKALLLSLLVSPLFVQAQIEKRHYYADEGLVPVEHSVDMTKLKLHLSFEMEKGKVIGEVEEQFTVLQKEIDSLVLNAVRLNVEEVQLNGSNIRFTNTNKTLVLHFEPSLKWNTEHTIQIKYHAFPRKGLYFIGWKDSTNRSRKQIWTQGQGINNRHWIPMFDEKNDKLITEVIVDFDEDYQVLSNGKKLKEKKLGNGLKQWHYKISNPHASYLIMLGIGKYDIEKRKSASGVEMNLYYYPDQAEQIKPTYEHSVRMFDYFEKEIGVPYPWSVYSQIPVQDFMYGAMENTTATLFGDFYLIDQRGFLDRNYVRVNAHELAHQWFGDMITARSSAHHWLQESFATHYDLVYQGVAFGEDHFDWTRRNYNNQALKASLSDLKPLAHSSAGTVRHYPKGAFVLQMLKYVVGREQFNAAIKYYLEKHAYGNVDSKDLLVAFHERLGLSLNWFWEDWVYKGGEPHYKVEFKEEESKGTFLVQQVHEQNELVDLFKMPIQFEVYFTDGSSLSKQVVIEEAFQQVNFSWESGKKIDYVLFDPNNQILRQLTFPKSTEMLKAQAMNAKYMLDRYDAVKELIELEFDGKVEFLNQVYSKETFHAIKAEILKFMLPQLTKESIELTENAIADKDVELRKAVVNSTVRIPNELKENYITLLQDPSYEVIEKTLSLLCFYFPNEVEQFLEITKDEIGIRSHNIRIEWLKQAYLHDGNQIYLDELVDLSGPSFEFLTRLNAAECLQSLNYLDETALKNMLDATFSFNSRLASPVSKVLDHFFLQDEYKKMILNYVSNETWNDYEFKKVRKFLIP